MKKSFKLLGVSLLSCSFLIGCNSVDSGAIEESATDFLTHTSIKSSSIVASDAFEVANTLSQAGKDDKGGFYLRYLTPFRVNSTSNVTLTYIRTYGSDVKNVSVSSVYDSVKNSDGKVLYYDGTDLVEKTAESKTDWYIAAYTIKFDSTAEGFNADALNYMITAELNVTVGAETKKASKETSYNLNYDFTGQTIYFKSIVVNGHNWANDDAGTAVILVDENNKELNVTYENETVIRELATYETNPGYYENTKYWSYTINNSYAKKVKFVRTNPDGKDYWNAETDYITLSPLTNLYAISADQTSIWKDSNETKDYCAKYDSSLVNFDSLKRATATATVSISNPDGGTATLDAESYLVGDTAKITVSPNEGYVLSSITNNGVAVEVASNVVYLNLTEEVNNFVVTFEEGTPVSQIMDLYFKAPSNFSYNGTQGYIHLWKDGLSADVAWPGRKMTWVEKTDNCNIWLIKDIDISNYDYCIFVVWVENEGNYTGVKHQSADTPLSSRGENNMFVSTNDWQCTGSWTTYTKAQQ